jgi:hypothetical protein
MGFTDGTNYITWNIASIVWVRFSPTDELVSLGGICLGLTTNNIVDYSGPSNLF